MKADIINDAPPGFDQRFLHWVRQLQDRLSIRFADWTPLLPLDLPKVIQQPLPTEIELYYTHATPFGLLRSGWDVWEQRLNAYQTAWARSLGTSVGIDADQAGVLISESPHLWPVNCSEKGGDEVGFVWQGGRIAVIELDLARGGRARPVAVGLRSWFLTSIALEILWEEYRVAEPEGLRHHPKVVEASNWPTSPPFPDHFALKLSNEL